MGPERKRWTAYSALARRKLKLNFAICQLIIYLKSNWKLILQHERTESPLRKKVRQSFRLSTFDFGFPFSGEFAKPGILGRRSSGAVNAFPFPLCLSLFLAQKAVIKYFVAYKMALLLENSISLQFLATAGFQQKPSGQGKFWREVGFSSKGTAAEKNFWHEWIPRQL